MAGVNIVQAEFFHTDAESLNAVVAQCVERITDGSPIKTVVRFFDDDGAMTKQVLKLENLMKRRTALNTVIFNSQGIWQRIQEVRYQRLGRKINKNKKSAQLLATAKLEMFARASRPIAIEHGEHRFRIAYRDETHEILESARAATDVWFFVFRPNFLLADTNNPVASALW